MRAGAPAGRGLESARHGVSYVGRGFSPAAHVNAERWLIATVTDLLTRRELMREEPVVQLM